MKTFDQFINESEHTETKLVDFFASLARNYESDRPFYTDLFQFVTVEELKDWKKAKDVVQLEKTNEIKANYKIKFTQDEKPCVSKIKFSFFVKGQIEKDAPEAMSSEDENRLNIVLEKIKIHELTVKTTSYDTVLKNKEITPPIIKACEPFLLKVLEDDYDSQGSEIYKIEH